MKNEDPKAYLIGGGIASLSAAVYLIKDGGVKGENIYIFEENNELGGSLDGTGSPEIGYIARGGRMFSEEVYSCAYDLFSQIPLVSGEPKTLEDDFEEFNKQVKINAGARLVSNGKIVNSANFGIDIADSLNMMKLVALPESFLDRSLISDHFSPAFFKTNFWFEWCTTFAFEPWHSATEFKRYILRFVQEFPGMNTMTGVRNTRYNQYDSIVSPISNWLNEKGVNFVMESRVISLKFIKRNGIEQVEKLIYLGRQGQKEISMGENDLTFFTNGSMTTNSTCGNMKSAPILNREAPEDSWRLWKEISEKRPHFGNPASFDGHIEESKWESFSVTFRGREFVGLFEAFSKNKPGTGGITTFKDSNWLLSIVIPPEPHFKNQPDSITVLWGYGLYPDKEGNYVHKKMSECTGEEIMIEFCSHLGFQTKIPKILEGADCVPCMMPYITSQFMPRKKGDRPHVIPENTRNFAFIGQYCEIQDEIVFTVEQSVRSAMIAVYSLLNIKKDIPHIYKGQYVPEVVKEFVRMVFNISISAILPTKKSR